MRELVDLKVGDVLFEPSRSGMSFGTFHKVERLTATRAFVARGYAFRLKDGNRVGDKGRWNSSWVRKATQADFDNETMRNRLYKARQAIEKLKVSEENVAHVEEFLAKLASDPSA